MATKYPLKPAIALAAQTLGIQATGRQLWNNPRHRHAICATLDITTGQLWAAHDPREPDPTIDFYTADRIAITLGKLPWEIWPQWLRDEANHPEAA